MLFIELNEFRPCEKKLISCHVGEKEINAVPVMRINSLAEYVIEIQADCHELEFIKSNFDNIPMPNNSNVVTFYGDIARCIVKHWR